MDIFVYICTTNIKTTDMRTTIIALSMFTCLSASAQTAREEIHEHIGRCGSNYLAYETPTRPLTKAPKGYEPFYISHYGRHGSRWLLGDGDYRRPINTLREALDKDELTSDGKELLRRMEAFYPTTIKRLGDLTTVGERQHHGIGRRMTERFPEVFSGDAFVDARSTVVIRCILSMTAECEEIAAFNPNVHIHNDVSESLQYYLNQDDNRKMRDIKGSGWQIKQDYKQKFTHPDRFCQSLFTKGTGYFKNEDEAKSFMRAVFEVCTNMQSHDTDIQLWEYFTEDELYDLWKIRNIDWYISYGPSPVSQGLAPFSQRNLLRNIIESADTLLASGTHGAALRFGHEVCVMPLACLLELDSCARQVENLDELDKQWVNYRIYPMAANIQLVFYRPKKGDGDILVKALLNENEATMPVKTDNYPYYKWKDLREFYLKKLDTFSEE